MRTRIEFFKEIGPRNMSDVPRLELTLHEANMIHKTLVKAHKQAQTAHMLIHQAALEAQRTAIETYAALSGFESELLHFQEKFHLSEMQRFKLATYEEEEEGEEHA